MFDWRIYAHIVLWFWQVALRRVYMYGERFEDLRPLISYLDDRIVLDVDVGMHSGMPCSSL